MSASRPVLANFDESELQTIIEENNCGLFTVAGDEDAFMNAIIKMYQNRDMCKSLGENGRCFVMSNLTKEIGTSKYVEVLNRIGKVD